MGRGVVLVETDACGWIQGLPWWGKRARGTNSRTGHSRTPISGSMLTSLSSGSESESRGTTNTYVRRLAGVHSSTVADIVASTLLPVVHSVKEMKYVPARNGGSVLRVM